MTTSPSGPSARSSRAVPLRRFVAGVGAVALLATGCSTATDVPVTSEYTTAPGDGELAVPPLGTSADDLRATVVTFVTADGEEVPIVARVADTPETRRTGLMGVETLPDGVGMLFEMGGPVENGFWMRDTPVALDIAYIGTGARILSIVQMDPCVDYEVATEDCPSYPPGGVYDRTVEVRQGWFAEVGITVGDEVRVADSP